MNFAIERFLDEVRARPRITEDHLAIVEAGLLNAYLAADDSPKYQEFWDDIEDVISQWDRTVKDRLAALGPIATAFEAKHAMPVNVARPS